MKQAYIINGIRTPIGNFGGTLSVMRTDDLAALVISELMKRNPSVDQKEIGDVLFGCANQAGEDNRNVARMALLLAGLPCSIPGETVNRLCASSLSASISAARAIAVGDADLLIAGGVENMTRAPYALSKPSAPFGRDAQLYDTSIGWRFVNPKMKEKYGIDGMGETAENLNDTHKISREDQDKFALWSQLKAVKAQQTGRLIKEIIPVEIPQKKKSPSPTLPKGKGELSPSGRDGEGLFDTDEFVKSNTTLEILSKLKPAFRKDGTVTAGNSSGLNDGAAALLLASEEGIKKYSLKPMVRIVSSAVVGVEPRIMGIGPVEASNRALRKAGLKMNDMEIIELNEAFAVQALACTRSWGLADNDARVNPNGGAIALGHPLGMSGARILLTAAVELQEQNKKYGLVTMCVGVGQGYAVVMEKC